MGYGISWGQGWDKYGDTESNTYIFLLPNKIQMHEISEVSKRNTRMSNTITNTD